MQEQREAFIAFTKPGSAWRKGEEGVDFGKKRHLGVVWVCLDCRIRFSECISTISLEIQLLALRGCSFFCSLRFMSKQDNSSSGAVFFPPFLGSLHINMSGFVPGNYTFLLWHKDAKPLWCGAVLHGGGLVRSLPGQTATLWWETSSRVSDGKKKEKKKVI